MPMLKKLKEVLNDVARDVHEKLNIIERKCLPELKQLQQKEIIKKEIVPPIRHPEKPMRFNLN